MHHIVLQINDLKVKMYIYDIFMTTRGSENAQYYEIIGVTGSGFTSFMCLSHKYQDLWL